MVAHQRLELRHGQGLVMTPKLQQAIKLLQLSNSDLSDFITKQMEANPLIQYADQSLDTGASAAREAGSADPNGPGADNPQNAERPAITERPAGADITNEPLATIADADAAASAGPSLKTDWSRTRHAPANEHPHPVSQEMPQPLSLRAHLYQEMASHSFAPSERQIASILIDDTDDAGYCKADLPEVASQFEVTVKTVRDVLVKCQAFDPAGIMAQDLVDCLRLQLVERDRYNPCIAILLENLELLETHDLTGLSKVCGVDQNGITEMLAELRQLNPKPGASFSVETAIPIIPDIIMSEPEAGLYAVELNTECLPRLLMDRAYYAEIAAHQIDRAEREFMANCFENANWLIKALDQRAQTILKVSREIVREQDAFFSDGVINLKPLTLRQIAERVGLHESTVSRATSNKYISTPRGVFELRYFFSSKLPAHNGHRAQSAKAVQHQIKTLINNEGMTPLSDETITTILNQQGTDIARRTVAKYREDMRLPSSMARNQKLKAYRHSKAVLAAPVQ